MIIRAIPVEKPEHLRGRVNYYFRAQRFGKTYLKNKNQILLDLKVKEEFENASLSSPLKSTKEFLDFMSDAVPGGEIYLFGGILRDLALYGKKGFDSDIDIVIEGKWEHFVEYLLSLNAKKNKFGGYRVVVDETPVDIWNAKETWAIRQGYVAYKGVSSLLDTTVLNWDGILMNWRTKNFIHREQYFDELKERALDIVLKENPNPLGMAVRVFRHMYLKDARKISINAVRYLIECVRKYSYDELRRTEYKSYKKCFIKKPLYDFFRNIKCDDMETICHNFGIESKIARNSLELAF